jgi:hypothetical protein
MASGSLDRQIKGTILNDQGHNFHPSVTKATLYVSYGKGEHHGKAIRA